MSAAAPTRHVDDDRAGVPFILASVTVFALQDAFMKTVSAETTLWQLQLVRASFVLIGLAAIVVLGRGERIVPRRLGLAVLRGVLGAGAYLCFYGSLPLLTMSQAAAAFFVSPLFVVVFARVWLGEPIGPRRAIAIGLGFLGVLFIVRPLDAEISVAALLPVAGAAFYAACIVMTRAGLREESPLALTASMTVVFAAIGAAGVLIAPLAPFSDATRAENAFLLEGWRDLAPHAVAMIAVTAGTFLLGNLWAARAYQLTPASRVAPFEYAYLLWPPLFDVVLFGSAPRVETLIGMALIAAAGGFVAWRVEGGAPPRSVD